MNRTILFLLTFICIHASAQPLKIGELNSYKVFPAFLEPYKKGMELAVEEINAAGRKVELVERVAVAVLPDDLVGEGLGGEEQDFELAGEAGDRETHVRGEGPHPEVDPLP